MRGMYSQHELVFIVPQQKNGFKKERRTVQDQYEYFYLSPWRLAFMKVAKGYRNGATIDFFVIMWSLATGRLDVTTLISAECGPSLVVMAILHLW